MSNKQQTDSDRANTDSLGWGIINVSVCNLRVEGTYSAGMASQALLGMPVEIVGKDDWLQVRTPDDYVTWVQPRSVHRVTREQLSDWNRAPQVEVTAIYGFVYSQPDVHSPIVSDVAAANRLRLLATTDRFYEVGYPDGRHGYLSKTDGLPLDTWRRQLRQDAASIIATGLSINGIPYMWGGMSTKGADCSGFVRITLLRHDIIIPRDAWQMAEKGQHLDIAPDFSNLVPGDLVFFGRKATDEEPAHVSHVGIYLGQQRFIHSLGWVHVSSFNPADEEYDEYDLNRLLWAQRILPYINKEEGLLTTEQSAYYK